jgi:hypothetical protein
MSLVQVFPGNRDFKSSYFNTYYQYVENLSLNTHMIQLILTIMIAC